MADPSKFNANNTSVKRIMREMREMSQEESHEYAAEALADNIFEWIFAIRGPKDTEFDGGIYIGRISLPAEYPLKPPSFQFLTPNGRFEVNKKICLSISQHHPDEWQPSWSMRTALTALIAFMPTPGQGAVGALEYSKEERVALAKASRVETPTAGNESIRKVAVQLHRTLLDREARQELKSQASNGPSFAVNKPAEEPATPPSGPAPAPAAPSPFGSPGRPPAAPSTPQASTAATPATPPQAHAPEPSPSGIRNRMAGAAAAAASAAAASSAAAAGPASPSGPTHRSPPPPMRSRPRASHVPGSRFRVGGSGRGEDDAALTRLAYLLAFAIGLMVVRKVIRIAAAIMA